MKRFKMWLEWANRCNNGMFYKVMVLFCLANSPSFTSYYTLTRRAK